MKHFMLFAALFLLLFSCGTNKINPKWTQKKAPETFKARFETTQGDFEIEAHRSWSPEGVDRLYQLIKSGFYTDIAVFRVIPGFVAQFGISNDSLLNKFWDRYPLTDEPVLQSNDSMTVAFARDGVNSRTTQLFINLTNNHRLDTVNFNGVTGFPVIARVTKGMENVLQFYDTQDNVPDQDSIQKYGNEYLKRNYPRIDYIKKAYLIEKNH